MGGEPRLDLHRTRQKPRLGVPNACPTGICYGERGTTGEVDQMMCCNYPGNADSNSDETLRDCCAQTRCIGIEFLRNARCIAAQPAIQEMKPETRLRSRSNCRSKRAMQVVDFARATVPGALIVAYSAPGRRLWNAASCRGVNDFLHGKITRDQVRKLPSRARRNARTIRAIPDVVENAVSSRRWPEGGIGKTTTSTNLAAAIAPREAVGSLDRPRYALRDVAVMRSDGE